MPDHDPIDIHKLRQRAWKTACGFIVGHPPLDQRTISVIAALIVQHLFAVLQKQQRLSLNDAKAFYFSVYYDVNRRLQQQYGMKNSTAWNPDFHRSNRTHFTP
ncbi:MAG: hypothetical protein OXC18_14785 [Desulfurellaceae bacterium]|nr:hypothetical protein [Desulfurellaceae bacterium]